MSLIADDLAVLAGPQPLRVHDLKQYVYCPRIVFYDTVMPVERKQTVKMKRGKDEEFRLDALEKRRSLRRYRLLEGERRFHVWLESARLGLSGKLDLLLISPTGYFPVDFKYTRGRPRRNHVFQLAGYALLIEDEYGVAVDTGFLYMVAIQEIVRIPLTQELKRKTLALLEEIRRMSKEAILPSPTDLRTRCEACEFRNYCGDIF